MKIATLVAATAAVAGAVQAAELTAFKQPNFSGDALTLRNESGSLMNQGFHDQISSLHIKSGRWQACTQPNYQGDCVTLEPGEYRTLDQRLNHRIESIRPLVQVAEERRFDRYASNDRYTRDSRWEGRRFAKRGAIELFARPDFGGRSAWVYEDTESLEGVGLDQRVSSLVIHEGRWQVCTQPGFEGRCRIVEPGSYPELGRFDNRIESVRRVG